METLRISFLAALVIPVATTFACGGNDNPSSTPKDGGSSGASTTGNGGSTSGNGGSTSGNGGSTTAGTTGAGGFMLPPIPMEKIVPDPTCPDVTFTIPDGGMVPPGSIPDGGLTLKGCCDQTGVCGGAVQRNFSFGGMQYNISLCATPADFGMFNGGIDAGPSKPCKYPKDGG